MFKRIQQLSLASVFVLLMTSCGGGGGGTPPTPPTPPAVKPQPPTISMVTGCVSASNCAATFHWTQADFVANQNFSTIFTISANGSVFDTFSTADSSASNTVNYTQKPLVVGTAYSVTAVTKNTADQSSPSTEVSSTPLYSPWTSVSGNGILIYDLNKDLQNATSCTSATSQWITGFTGSSAINNLKYIYPVLGYITQVPVVNAGENFSSYVSRTVDQTCGPAPSGSNLGFGYVTSSANFGTINGTAVTAAYHQWPTSVEQKGNLKSNTNVRVMPIIEFASNTPFGGCPSVSSTTVDIDYLAHAITQVVDNDPNADGMIFDYEHHASCPAQANAVYYFFQQLAFYLASDAQAAGRNPKFLAVFANTGFFTSVVDPNGTSLWSLFSKNTGVTCRTGNCFIVIPQYDVGDTSAPANGNGDQALFGVQGYTTDINTMNSQDPSSTVNTPINNQVNFQFGVPASASFDNWTQAYVYGNFSESGYSIGSQLAQSGSCPAGASNCTSVTQLNPGGSNTKQSDYMCAALTTFQHLIDGTSGTVGCTPIYPGSITTTATPNITNYFMGVALWRLADDGTESTCNPGNAFCVAVAPTTLVPGDATSGSGGSIALLNAWNYNPGFQQKFNPGFCGVLRIYKNGQMIFMSAKKEDQRMAEKLINTYRRFGKFGPAYQIISIGSVQPNGEILMRILVLESKEKLEYPLSKILSDPIAA